MTNSCNPSVAFDRSLFLFNHVQDEPQVALNQIAQNNDKQVLMTMARFFEHTG